jgi:hypothetical protein
MNAYLEMIEIRPQSDLASKARLALERAMVLDGKVSQDILALEGMSGKKYRYFVNNLIESMEDPRYLEIGVWAGSTLCSAIFGNSVTVTAIDNWSQFEGPSDRFFLNLSRFKGPGAKVSILERDFRRIDYQSLGVHDVYLFDGPHNEVDQHDGLTLTQAALAKEFVLVVDDWNWTPVRTGTFRAIRELGLRVDFCAEIRTTLDGSQPPVNRNSSDWHNGYLIAVLCKSSA